MNRNLVLALLILVTGCGATRKYQRSPTGFRVDIPPETGWSEKDITAQLLAVERVFGPIPHLDRLTIKIYYADLLNAVCQQPSYGCIYHPERHMNIASFLDGRCPHRTAIIHEFIHDWLFMVDGDPDYDHKRPHWAKVDDLREVAYELQDCKEGR